MNKKNADPASIIAKALADVLSDPLESLSENLQRVRHVLSLYRDTYGHGAGRRSANKSDLLRFAVVFLHATIEEFLRSVAAYYLPLSSEEALNRIPLVGLNSVGRPEKFLLGRLTHHRGKTVDALLDASVSDYLTRLSFNDTTDIMALIQDCGLRPSKELDLILPKIQKIMERRHKIVHNTDRLKGKDGRKLKASSLSVNQVEEWIKNTFDFSKQVISAMIEQQLENQREQIKEITLRAKNNSQDKIETSAESIDTNSEE
jgi:hypothetical protein